MDIRSNIIYHLKELVDQKNVKQKPAYFAKEVGKTESSGLGKKQRTDIVQRRCKKYLNM